MAMNIQKIDKFGAFFIKVFMYLSIFFSGGGLIKYTFFEKHYENFKIFTSANKFETSIFINQLLNFDGSALMMLGVLVLMMLPIIRIIFALLGFIADKNRLYIVICIIIMLIIGFSFYLGR